jgi:aspartate aminotransferase
MIFNKRVTQSITGELAEAAGNRLRKGLPIISLGLGEPDFDVPDHIKEAMIEVIKTSKSGYSDPLGLPGLREKIASKLREENSIKCSLENIFVTAGSKQAFTLICMSLLEPGDETIIINPSFVSYIPQILIAESTSKIITVDINKSDFSISIEKIRNKITKKTKLIVVNSPNNPTGYIFETDFLEHLFRLSIEHGFYIISDEVYDRLIFSGKPHFSIGAFEEEPTKIITVNSFSKSYAMSAWSLGYACYPKILRNKLLNLQKHINTNTCTIIQKALEKVSIIENHHLVWYNRKLLKRAEFISQFISHEDRISLIPPKAGFFAFCNIAKTHIKSIAFCTSLIKETGVAFTPGLVFGKSWDDHVRISFATSDEILAKGLELLKGFVQSLQY